MEISQDDILYKCGCGEFTGSWAQIQGHRGRRKSETCKLPATVVLSADIEDKAAEAVLGREPEDPEAPDQFGDGDDDDPLAFARAGRRQAAKVQDPNTKNPGRVRNYGAATAVRSTYEVPVYLYVMYDVWRNTKRYGGNFNDWLVESMMDYWGMCGFELILAQVQRGMDAAAAEVSQSNGVAELVNATNGN